MPVRQFSRIFFRASAFVRPFPDTRRTVLSAAMIADYHMSPFPSSRQISSTSQSPGRTDSMSSISFLRASYFTFVSHVGVETGSSEFMLSIIPDSGRIEKYERHVD